MLSDTARTGPSTLTVFDRTTWKEGKEKLEVRGVCLVGGRGEGGTQVAGGMVCSRTGDSNISPQVI